MEAHLWQSPSRSSYPLTVNRFYLSFHMHWHYFDPHIVHNICMSCTTLYFCKQIYDPSGLLEKIAHRSIRDFLPPCSRFLSSSSLLSPYFSFFAAFRCIASVCKTNSEDIVKMDSSKFGKLSAGLIVNLRFCAMQGFPGIRPCLSFLNPNGVLMHPSNL